MNLKADYSRREFASQLKKMATIAIFAPQLILRNASAATTIVTGKKKPVATAGGGADITDSLVAWWKFEEGSGTSAADSVGSNTETLTGSTLPSWVAGKVGTSALSFNGSTAYLHGPAGVIGATASTLSLWANTVAVNIAVQSLIDNVKVEWWIDNQAKMVFTGDSQSTIAFSAAGSITTATWQMLSVTRDATGVTNLYVNGVLSGTANQASGTPATSIFDCNIASYGIGGSALYGGALDDVRIYSRVLSAAELLQIHTLYA